MCSKQSDSIGLVEQVVGESFLPQAAQAGMDTSYEKVWPLAVKRICFKLCAHDVCASSFWGLLMSFVAGNILCGDAGCIRCHHIGCRGELYQEDCGEGRSQHCQPGPTHQGLCCALARQSRIPDPLPAVRAAQFCNLFP